MIELVGKGWDGGILYQFKSEGKYVTVTTGRLRVSSGLYRRIEEQVRRVIKNKVLR
jgi:hypothetical protein